MRDSTQTREGDSRRGEGSLLRGRHTPESTSTSFSIQKRFHLYFPYSPRAHPPKSCKFNTSIFYEKAPQSSSPFCRAGSSGTGFLLALCRQAPQTLLSSNKPHCLLTKCVYSVVLHPGPAGLPLKSALRHPSEVETAVRGCRRPALSIYPALSTVLTAYTVCV